MHENGLSTRLLAARKARDLSQQALADLLNIQRRNISHWENGVSNPSITLLTQLADILEISIEWLTTGKGVRDLKDYQLASKTQKKQVSQIPVTDELLQFIKLFDKLSDKQKRIILELMKEL